MRQNRSITHSKGHRNKNSGISSLTSSLFNKIDDLCIQDTFKPRPSIKGTQKFILPRFEESQQITLNTPLKQSKEIEPLSILQKARQITSSKQNKILRAKELYRKSHMETQGMFLTGCGLYLVQQPQTIHNQDNESVDMNDALRYLVSHEKDDLEELRRMIKKTSFNIKQYSNQVNRTKNKIMNAADIFKKEISSDLRMRITKHKPLQSDFSEFQENIPRRRLSTSTNRRLKNIY